MALPDSQHSPGFKPLPTNQRKRPKSYAQAVTATTRVSLLHSHIIPPDVEDEQTLNTLNTRVYKPSRTKGAYLFDITPCKKQYTDLQSMLLLKDQHPNVHACVPLSDGDQRYLEVYVTKENDTNDILYQGIIFKELKLQVLPCKAIDDSAKILKLKLTHIPLQTKNEVVAGLQTSLAIFGKILDVGINTEPSTGFFMGTGYAVLDRYQSETISPEEKFQDLHHKINWCEDENESFRATWNNMPMWCRYCHKDGHTKFDCKDAKARILCYACHEKGHRSFECPRKTNNTKKARKTYQTRQSTVKNQQESTEDNVEQSSNDDKVLVEENDSEYTPSESGQDEDEEDDDDDKSDRMEEDEAQLLAADQVEIEKLHQDLDAYGIDEVEQVMIDLETSKEICPLYEDSKDSTIITSWKILKHTMRAIAFTSWYSRSKIQQLTLSSTSKHKNKASSRTLGDFVIPPNPTKSLQ